MDMFFLKPVSNKGNKIIMIGQIIKIDVLGLGIEPSIGKCMATRRYVRIGKQTNWDSGWETKCVR